MEVLKCVCVSAQLSLDMHSKVSGGGGRGEGGALGGGWGGGGI